MDTLSLEIAILVVLGCTVVGLVLLLIEIVLVPGVGAPGVAGSTLIGVGIVYAFAAGGFLWGFVTLAGAAAIIVLALRTLGFTLGPRVVLGEELATPPARVEELLGHEGRALTPLRPSGLARIDGRRVAVTSGTDWLEAGTPVVVASVESSQAFVERLAGAQPAGTDSELESEHHG